MRPEKLQDASVWSRVLFCGAALWLDHLRERPDAFLREDGEELIAVKDALLEERVRAREERHEPLLSFAAATWLRQDTQNLDFSFLLMKMSQNMSK